MEDNLATYIIRRANKCGISINKLCEAAGVSRRWFEYLKQRTPRPVEVYLKIDEILTALETDKEMKREIDKEDR